MSRACDLCGKTVVAGGCTTRRGLAKKLGGVGSRVIASNKRVFRPNVHRMRAVVSGAIKRINVCSSCIQAGKVTKPVKRNYEKAA
ncbi:50S ribosomal protein L28 [Planctomycetaceae bacterium]|nr:50S ribosomal protein L28 [Planctomycetaceae bacterium]